LVGLVPVVDELDEPLPDVPDVPEDPLPPVPDMPLLPVPLVPLLPVPPEVEPLPLVPEVSEDVPPVVPEAPAEPLPDMEELELLLGVPVVSVDDGVVVVVLGEVELVEDELLGVEPELPLLPLLHPVAATEARAMTATRGIRRFMLLSPICTLRKFVWLRGSLVLRERSAAPLDARQRILHAQPVPRLARGRHRGKPQVREDFLAKLRKTLRGNRFVPNLT
jgi:hypothetical protein